LTLFLNFLILIFLLLKNVFTKILSVCNSLCHAQFFNFRIVFLRWQRIPLKLAILADRAHPFGNVQFLYIGNDLSYARSENGVDSTYSCLQLQFREYPIVLLPSPSCRGTAQRFHVGFIVARPVALYRTLLQ